MDEKRIPILVGSGKITQREQDPLVALSPMDLTASAGFKAADDTHIGKSILKKLDTIVVIRSFSDKSWRLNAHLVNTVIHHFHYQNVWVQKILIV